MLNYTRTVLFTGSKSHLVTKPINWRELYAIVKDIAAWGHFLCNNKLLLHCHNESVTAIINSGTSRDQDIMKLVRILLYMCAYYNIECICQHNPGVYKIEADLLSRNKLTDYFNYNPNAASVMTLPIDIWYDDILI
jgi:hypothetical protein